MNIETKLKKIFQDAVDRADGNKAAAARYFGVGPVTFFGWVDKDKGIGKNKTLFEALDRVGVRLVEPDETITRYKPIPLYGVGDTPSGDTNPLAFNRDLLARQEITDEAVMIRIPDDSMEPTLRSGDVALVDRGDIEIKDGRVYLCSFQGRVLLKRIFHTVAGLRLTADNSVYIDTDIPQDYLSDFIVYGRVRWFGRFV
jgi:hypothetical protein